MSYCVKCGVELHEQETKCPLCGVKVYNPDGLGKPAMKSFPQRKERATVRYIKNRYNNITGFCIAICMIIVSIINLSINGTISWSKFILSSLALLWFCMVFPVKYSDRIHPALLSSICVLVAALFAFYIDYLTQFKGWSLYVLNSAAFASFAVCLPLMADKMRVKNIISFNSAAAAAFILLTDAIAGFKGWSVYITGAMALVWAFILLPCYINRKYNVIGAIVFDSLLILGYLLFVLSAGNNTDKFFSFALPAVAVFSLPVIFIYLLTKHFRFSVYGILSACFMFAGIVSLAADYILNYNIFHKDVLFNQWSLITAACCCLVISPLLFITEKNAALQEFLKKKFNL